jgi:TolB-like protein/Flp pilus assembly protein TadD
VPSLAVLYFENLAADPDSEYFCAGITEDILTDLSKIKGLRVASRNAVSRYRGAPADIARVATELGVGTVLEGSVRRAGNRVRISAQLINAADGFHLWAERYDRTLQDVFAVQEEIASSIAEALRGALSPAETKELQRDRPGDVKAYDLYLKGREFYGKYSVEAFQKALELFQQAIATDPNYALAWAGIADCYGQMLSNSAVRDRAEAVRVGLEAARRAIQIDSKLAEAHKAEALVLKYSGDGAGSRAALERALEVNPRFVPAYINLSIEYFGLGNLAGAERLLRRSLEIDPQREFSMVWLAYLLKLTSREDEVLPVVKRMEELDAENPFYRTNTYGMRAWLEFDRGNLDAVERIMRDAHSAGAEPSCIGAVEAAVAARRGRSDEARRLMKEVEGSAELLPGFRSLLAGAALRVGEPERAVRLFQHPSIADFVPMLLRLIPEVHPLLDREPFAPRRWNTALVWPLEAPMIDAIRHALFREVRIESGLPQGSGVAVK